ncbi:hypothetical protein [Bacillus methanolicus]|uniref:Uncharacterized protein n=1 Tax=Bacillus methanolicus (strain MGA3 / ATCC 53907) TaxID=796606 RepID=I3E9I5_BACMM|nr:hypothetical protein [Bacillus methanolicus]AIE60404.1 hypothetical protein BMMGA3_10040 [Bacillus methanolicus MGA3]EIJ83156.1 hypothetical protein MGA3_08040 [Bacillus methanolicus MGA3]
MDYGYLLNQYRSIWNNRLLESDESSEEIIKEAVKRELLDENSHPRVRKSVHEKFYLAVKRIVESQLNEEDKFALITLHIQIMKDLKQN